MRLLTKTTIYFFTAMALLVLLTGFYLFHQFSHQLNERSDKELLAEEAGWVDYLETGVEEGTAFILRTRDVSIFPVNAPASDKTAIQDVTGENGIPYRQLSAVISVGGISYQVIIKRSQEQKAALVAGFTRIMIGVLVVLILVSLLFNWIISRTLWLPFRRSLHAISNTELPRIQSLRFEETDTEEFNELNNALGSMAQKIHRDYINMKEFTENAAHEMQTPIAVVQSKLELLLQDHELGEKQLQSIAEASEVLTGLSKLNQGLLLLAKIENNQYQAEAPVNIASVCARYLRLFEDLIKDKSLAIETWFETDFLVPLHPLLADSLVMNLLGNAIKYNYNGGKIRLETGTDFLSISNTSNLPAIPDDKIFKRFQPGIDKTGNSNGLGLAIVKRIAETANIHISYEHNNGMHVFRLTKMRG